MPGVMMRWLGLGLAVLLWSGAAWAEAPAWEEWVLPAAEGQVLATPLPGRWLEAPLAVVAQGDGIELRAPGAGGAEPLGRWSVAGVGRLLGAEFDAHWLWLEGVEGNALIERAGGVVWQGDEEVAPAPDGGAWLVTQEDCQSELVIDGVSRGLVGGPSWAWAQLSNIHWPEEGLSGSVPCRPGASWGPGIEGGWVLVDESGPESRIRVLHADGAKADVIPSTSWFGGYLIEREPLSVRRVFTAAGGPEVLLRARPGALHSWGLWAHPEHGEVLSLVTDEEFLLIGRAGLLLAGPLEPGRDPRELRVGLQGATLRAGARAGQEVLWVDVEEGAQRLASMGTGQLLRLLPDAAWTQQGVWVVFRSTGAAWTYETGERLNPGLIAADGELLALEEEGGVVLLAAESGAVLACFEGRLVGNDRLAAPIVIEQPDGGYRWLRPTSGLSPSSPAGSAP